MKIFLGRKLNCNIVTNIRRVVLKITHFFLSLYFFVFLCLTFMFYIYYWKIFIRVKGNCAESFNPKIYKRFNKNDIVQHRDRGTPKRWGGGGKCHLQIHFPHKNTCCLLWQHYKHKIFLYYSLHYHILIFNSTTSIWKIENKCKTYTFSLVFLLNIQDKTRSKVNVLCGFSGGI